MTCGIFWKKRQERSIPDRSEETRSPTAFMHPLMAGLAHTLTRFLMMEIFRLYITSLLVHIALHGQPMFLTLDSKF
jgi:hypothetical protein